MYVATDNFQHIVNDYIVQVIVPKMPSDVLKFGLSFAAGYISNNTINAFMARYGAVITGLGIIVDNKVDLEKFKDNALKALQNCQDGKFTFMNYSFDRADVDAIYSIASTYAVVE